MKTNIKFFWFVNAITLLVIGTVYAHLTYGIFGSLPTKVTSWENIKTVAPYIGVVIVDVIILFAGIVPFAEALYEETTNNNTHSLKRYAKFLENVKRAPTRHPEFKKNIEHLIQNHTETAYQHSAQTMMKEFGEASPEIIARYIDRMAKNPLSISLTDELVSLSDSQLVAYGMFSRLDKPEQLEKMTHLSNTIHQFNSIVTNTMLNKQSDDTNTLLETVGA